MKRQSIGLKDCNGVMIYEGDVVIWETGEVNLSRLPRWRPAKVRNLGLVVWDITRARYTIATPESADIELHPGEKRLDKIVRADREAYCSGDYREQWGVLEAGMIKDANGFSVWPAEDQLRCPFVRTIGQIDSELMKSEFDELGFDRDRIDFDKTINYYYSTFWRNAVKK